MTNNYQLHKLECLDADFKSLNLELTDLIEESEELEEEQAYLDKHNDAWYADANNPSIIG